MICYFPLKVENVNFAPQLDILVTFYSILIIKVKQ